MKTYAEFIASNSAFQKMHDFANRSKQIKKEITDNLMTGDGSMIKALLSEFPQAVVNGDPIETISNLATLKAKKEF